MTCTEDGRTLAQKYSQMAACSWSYDRRSCRITNIFIEKSQNNVSNQSINNNHSCKHTWLCLGCEPRVQYKGLFHFLAQHIYMNSALSKHETVNSSLMLVCKHRRIQFWLLLENVCVRRLHLHCIALHRIAFLDMTVLLKL